MFQEFRMQQPQTADATQGPQTRCSLRPSLREDEGQLLIVTQLPQGDASNLKGDVRRLVAALAEAHEEAAASVATLARIDAVKDRMQAAHDTLRVGVLLLSLSKPPVRLAIASTLRHQGSVTQEAKTRPLRSAGTSPLLCDANRRSGKTSPRARQCRQPTRG